MSDPVEARFASALGDVRTEETAYRTDDDRAAATLDRAKRRWIATLVVWAFLASLAFLLAATTWLVLDGRDWKAPAEFLLSVIAQVLLPVVTLVVGFYFGSERR